MATKGLVAAVAAVVAMAGACGADDDGSPESTATAVAGSGSGLDEGAIDETVEASMAETLVPGAVVLVRQGGEEYLAAYGTRTFGGDDAVTVDDYFRIGSNTKTWTGTVLLQLVDEGLISLDDAVAEYLPDVPNGENITVAQLLDMRSGLYSYSELLAFNQTLDEEPEKVWSPAELLELAFAEEPYFEPGGGYHYSNTNLVLAGLLIEQLTGNLVEEEFATRIFEPLGMENTVMPALDDASIPSPHPDGYLYGTNASTVEDMALPDDEQAEAEAGDLAPNDVTDASPSWGWTAGAGISTAADLADYVEVLVGGGLLSDELQQIRLDSIEPTDPDNPDSAGYGLALADFGPMVGHDGSLPGYQSFMAYSPDDDLTIIVLTNLQNGPDGAQPANEIARALMGMLLQRSAGADDDATTPL